MDGVLERIDEDEEQKTDQSFFTDPEEGEGAAEMRSGEKDSEAIKQEDDDHNATEPVMGDGIMKLSLIHI